MNKNVRYSVVVIFITMFVLTNWVNVAIRSFSSAEDNTQSSESIFQDRWGLDSSSMNRYYYGLEELKGLRYANEDSARLVIGLNAEREAFAGIVAEINRTQGKVVNTVSINSQAIAVVADVPFDAISLFAKKVRESDLARYVEPSIKFEAEIFPNDPNWPLQWGPKKIEANFAWNTTMGDHSIVVAVIDTGIDYTHPDLAGNYVPLGYDWVNYDTDPKDDHGHGTHCAGIIAAVINNTIGIAGVANVSIMAEKGLDAFGSGNDYQLANAIVHAVDQGADILSNSWGGSFDSQLIHDAIKYAYNHGVLVIFAAGNDHSNVEFYPAAYDEVISVTATDSSDSPAGFTNFGDWVEIAAPGVNIYSTMPTYNVTLNSPERPLNYAYLSGTSMACPHVAGVAALTWSKFPNATRDWVRAKLRYGTDDLGEPSFDKYYGYGRINARKAVEPVADHDLFAYSLEQPAQIQPGDIVSINASIMNFGTYDEENVTTQMFVDGSLTDSKVIDYAWKGTLATVSFSWNPLTEKVYNVTFYVVPVPGETVTENNAIMKMIRVRVPLGLVLFDVTRSNPDYSYREWMQIIRDKGYWVDTYAKGFVTSNMLARYDILVVAAPSFSYTSQEISAVCKFVMDGGGLSVVGGYDALTSFAGIGVGGESYFWAGLTNNITLHEVTKGIDSLHVFPSHRFFVTPPAISLVRDDNGLDETFLAVSEIGAGRVIAVDFSLLEDGKISRENNMKLANNMIDWLRPVKRQHEITVRLDYPYYLEPGENSVLNATICNRGLSNETNLDFQLWINSTMANSATIPELANGTGRTINFPFSSSIVAMYNITAYVLPVLGEDVTLNNIETEFVSVRYPLISPIEGQYANYSLYCYDSSGKWGVGGYWNFTYGRYIEPYKINITVRLATTYGYTDTLWQVVNTMDRQVEDGYDVYSYYYSWIETDLDIGSNVKLEYYVFPVSGSRIVTAVARAFDCWEIKMWSSLGYPYLHDKASGLLIRYESFTYPDFDPIDWVLADTNIPLGPRYEHDLGVSIDARLRIQPGEDSTLKATVYNLGLNNETNVQFKILINGTEVKNETPAELASGTWCSMNFSWTPAEGVYNITAYTSLMPVEGSRTNNIASAIVLVRWKEVALISDYSILMELIPVLDSIGLGFDTYNYNIKHLFTENSTILSRYRAVIYWKNYHLTTTEYDSLKSYLSSNGNLLISGCGVLGDDQLAKDLVRSYMFGNNMDEFDLFVTNKSHPIMSGPYGSFPEGYHIRGLAGICSVAKADKRRNAVSVAELADGCDKIIATEGIPGKVVFWNGMGIFDWLGNSDCQTMFKNLMYWFTARHELAVSLEVPSSIELNSSALITATARNIGYGNLDNVTLQLLINDTTVETATIPILANQTSYSLTYLWTPTVAGTYNITVYAPPVLGEAFAENNVRSKLVPTYSLNYQLKITTTSGGTTIPAPGTYTYASRSLIQVTAIPNEDYTFDYWKLDDVNVDSLNPYTILMDKNHTLKAVFTYSPPLSASISPLSASINVGQSLTFVSTVTGGAPPYSYQWYLNQKPVSEATSRSWIFTPTTSGIYRVYLKVTDVEGNTKQSETASITVAANPVGGYTFQIEEHTAEEPMTPYLALATILTIILIATRPKTTKKTNRSPKEIVHCRTF